MRKDPPTINEPKEKEMAINKKQVYEFNEVYYKTKDEAELAQLQDTLYKLGNDSEFTFNDLQEFNEFLDEHWELLAKIQKLKAKVKK